MGPARGAQELARNAPTLFYQHAERFLGSAWPALTDAKPHIREDAAKVLRCPPPVRGHDRAGGRS